MAKVTGTQRPRITGTQTDILGSSPLEIASTITIFENPSKIAQHKMRPIPKYYLFSIFYPFKKNSPIAMKKGAIAHKQEMIPILMPAKLLAQKFIMISKGMAIWSMPETKRSAITSLLNFWFETL